MLAVETKSGKAPGPGETSVKLLKTGPELLFNFLRELVSQILYLGSMEETFRSKVYLMQIGCILPKFSL